MYENVTSNGLGRYEGRPVDEIYRERARKLTKQPTDLVYDCNVPKYIEPDTSNTRGDHYSDGLTCMVYPALRVGLMLQAAALGLILCVYHGHGGRNSFTFDFFNFNDQLKTSGTFTFAMCCLLSLYGLGTTLMLAFHAFLNDNGKYSRGFRAGSKAFQTAVTLDLFTLGMRLLSFVYTYHFLQTRWWQHYNQTKADFSLFHFTALAHSVALILYGLGFFYLEGYHDEGTYEEFGWANLILFSLAGLSEMAMVLTGYGAFFAFLQLAALVVALVWSLSFEPLLHFHSTSLHDRTVNDGLMADNYQAMPNEHTVEYTL